MPVTKVHCHARADKGSFEVLEIPDCAACAASGLNPCQMTAPMVRYIHAKWKDSADRSPYSASKVGSCPRKAVLEQRYNWGSDPMENYATMRGTMIHDSLHEFVDPSAGEVAEVRVSREFMGVKLSGKFDFMQARTGVLYDYKTVGKLPPFQWAYVKHRDQLNVYRWLLHGQEIEYAGTRYTLSINKLLVEYISSDGWKQCQAKLLDFAEVESIIAKYINQVKPALDAGARWMEFLPGVLAYDDWECGYCDLRKACYSIKDQQLMEKSMEGDPENDITF